VAYIKALLWHFSGGIRKATTILRIVDARPTFEPPAYKSDALPLEPNWSLLPFCSRSCGVHALCCAQKGDTGVKTEFIFGTLQLLNVSGFLISTFRIRYCWSTSYVLQSKLPTPKYPCERIALQQWHCPWSEIPRWCQAHSSVGAKNRHENTKKVKVFYFSRKYNILYDLRFSQRWLRALYLLGCNAV
jgi:hypothetical protein